MISEVQRFDGKLQSYEEKTTVKSDMAFSTKKIEYNKEYKPAGPAYNPIYRGRRCYGSYRGIGDYS